MRFRTIDVQDGRLEHSRVSNTPSIPFHSLSLISSLSSPCVDPICIQGRESVQAENRSGFRILFAGAIGRQEPYRIDLASAGRALLNVTDVEDEVKGCHGFRAIGRQRRHCRCVVEFVC